MRCKACDKLLAYNDLIRVAPDAIDEDMCSDCRSIAFSVFRYAYDHDFIEPPSDGITPPRKTYG